MSILNRGLLNTIKANVDTLLSRLTSGRATNLDNLNTTVSSRAPSSTALSNAIWTDAKAGFLDQAISGISVIKSIQTGFVDQTTSSTGSGEDAFFVNVSISSVTTSKCFCYFQPWADQLGSTGIGTATARLTSNTNLRLAQKTISGSRAISGRWWVIEFK